MSFPNCDNRSVPNNRQNLTATYTITPVAHTKLLPGQELEGCCGRITNECYTFSYQNKLDTQDTGLFSVGRHCAQDFLSLTRKTAPPCFNPLTSTSTGGGGASAGSNTPTMCPLNLEVYQAINLLTLDWGPPKASTQAILTAIVSSPTTAIAKDYVIHLNNIIGKDRRGRKLTEIISALRVKHPTLRNFKFPTIHTLLSNANRPSNF